MVQQRIFLDFIVFVGKGEHLNFVQKRNCHLYDCVDCKFLNCVVVRALLCYCIHLFKLHRLNLLVILNTKNSYHQLSIVDLNLSNHQSFLLLVYMDLTQCFTILTSIMLSNQKNFLLIVVQMHQLIPPTSRVYCHYYYSYRFSIDSESICTFESYVRHVTILSYRLSTVCPCL